jgi:transglutaminase-like putative cysteine protease
MVVMARSVRIPARLAVGYAMGHYDPQRGAYVVTEKDGHAWPELCFPGYGWIAFEPTSGLGPLERASGAEEFEFSPPVFPSLPERSWWVRLQVEARLVWLRWRGLSGEGRVALSYTRLRRMASRLGVSVRPCDTPAEFAAAMERELVRRRSHVAWLEAAMRREAEQTLTGVFLVVRVYEQICYAPNLPDPDLMHRVWQEGHHLRWRLWRLWALSITPPPVDFQEVHR